LATTASACARHIDCLRVAGLLISPTAYSLGSDI
jgi:hypothetical protein